MNCKQLQTAVKWLLIARNLMHMPLLTALENLFSLILLSTQIFHPHPAGGEEE